MDAASFAHWLKRRPSRARFCWFVLIGVGLCGAAWAVVAAQRRSDSTTRLDLPPKFRRLLTLHSELEKPRPNDWLAKHYEAGQTFQQYIGSHPIRADARRRTIYIQPLGEFSDAQVKIVSDAAKFLGSYFQLPVQVREGISLDVVPKRARRKPSEQRAEQLLTTYLLAEVLKPRLPRDGVALIGFTSADLWPGEGWNYVFGQASLGDRVGVWSIHRYGDPDESDAAYQQCLLRTLKVASHEAGHMFSMAHCTFYECNLCGSNHLEEADRRPLEVCPNCLAKLCYATGADPQKRFETLIRFYKDRKLTVEQEFCEKSLAALRKK
jgi:archaemetzincin